MAMSQSFVTAPFVIVFCMIFCANARPAASVSEDDVILLTKLVAAHPHERTLARKRHAEIRFHSVLKQKLNEQRRMNRLRRLMNGVDSYGPMSIRDYAVALRKAKKSMSGSKKGSWYLKHTKSVRDLIGKL